MQGTTRTSKRVLGSMLPARDARADPATCASLTLDGWMQTYLDSADITERARAGQRYVWEHYSTPAWAAGGHRLVINGAAR